MDIDKFSSRMMELLPDMIRGFTRYEYNYLTRGKITLPQYLALEYLSHKGKSHMSSLACALDVSRPAATGLMDRLIAQKLVKRIDDANDRRVVWIDITPKGKSVIDDVKKQKSTSAIKVFGQLPAADREQFLRIIEQVVKILEVSKDDKNNKQ